MLIKKKISVKEITLILDKYSFQKNQLSNLMYSLLIDKMCS